MAFPIVSTATRLLGGGDLLQGDRKGGGWASPEIEVGVDACGGGDFSLVGVDILTTKTILGLIDFKKNVLFKINYPMYSPQNI